MMYETFDETYNDPELKPKATFPPVPTNPHLSTWIVTAVDRVRQMVRFRHALDHDNRGLFVEIPFSALSPSTPYFQVGSQLALTERLDQPAKDAILHHLNRGFPVLSPQPTPKAPRDGHGHCEAGAGGCEKCDAEARADEEAKFPFPPSQECGVEITPPFKPGDRVRLKSEAWELARAGEPEIMVVAKIANDGLIEMTHETWGSPALMAPEHLVLVEDNTTCLRCGHSAFEGLFSVECGRPGGCKTLDERVGEPSSYAFKGVLTPERYEEAGAPDVYSLLAISGETKWCTHGLGRYYATEELAVEAWKAARRLALALDGRVGEPQIMPADRSGSALSWDVFSSTDQSGIWWYAAGASESGMAAGPFTTQVLAVEAWKAAKIPRAPAADMPSEPIPDRMAAYMPYLK